MPAIPFGTGAYRRNVGNFAEIKCVNMFAEAAPTAEGQVALVGRPGLALSATRGTGPIRGIFREEGTFDGDVFCVSGNELYRGATSLGTIEGAGQVSFASSGFEIVVTAGESAYSYDGTDLEAVVLAEDPAEEFHVTSVTFVAGLFIYARKGSHQYYWSAVLDGRSVSGIDYASAESEPDALRDVRAIRGNLFLIGSATIELWYPSGDLDLPFARIDQRLYSRGARATGASIEADNTLFFIGQDNILYRLGDVPERVSDNALEERVQASGSATLFLIEHDGHKHICARLDDATFAYDVSTQQIWELASYGRHNFAGRCAVAVGSTVLLGDDGTGKLYAFTDTPEDDGGTLHALFTAGFGLKEGTAVLNDVTVEANVGWTQFLAGQGESPLIEMRSSRDAGATWGNWRSAPLGRQGRYRNRARWTRIGMFDFPGALLEFRITDPAPRRVSGVFVNAEGGGRSR
jgi:hypothetical protein